MGGMVIFSVIIPTRDRPAYLAEAVASVLGQSFRQFELLIVNDGESEIPDFQDNRVRVLDNKMRGAVAADRKSTRLNSSHGKLSRMPSSA